MLIWIIATIIAYFIRGLCGFGSTMIFGSILGFSVNNIDISPIELSLGFPANIVLTYKYRKFLSRKIYLPLLILVLAGSIPGVFFLKSADVKFVKALFGLFIIAIGIELIFRDKGKVLWQDSRAVMLILGIVAGAVSGVFGIGALVAAYVGRITNNNDEFKANISIVYLVESIVRLSLFIYLGLLTVSDLNTLAILIPIMLISLLAGIKCSQLINERVIRKLVIGLLIICGAALFIMNI